MIIISHRGNIRGSVLDKENSPSYIDCAIGSGYHVEIDIRSIDNKLWLGHDEPQYEIDHNWLDKRRDYLWLHCKNVEAAVECRTYHSFCHTDDPFTYTTTGKIWLHDLSMKIDNNIIIPLLEEKDIKNFSNKYQKVYAICTDYPLSIKNKIYGKN